MPNQEYLRPRLLIPAAVIGVCIVLLLVAAWLPPRAPKAVAKEGIPTSIRAFQEKYPAPPREDNAFHALNHLHDTYTALHVAPGEERYTFGPPGAAPSPRLLAVGAAMLSEHGSLAEHVHGILDEKPLIAERLPATWREWYETPPGYPRFAHLVSGLRIEVITHVESGRRDEALRAIRALMALAEAWAPNALGSHLWVWPAVVTAAGDSVAYFLNRMPLTKTEALEFQQWFRDAESLLVGVRQRALHWDSAIAFPTLDDLGWSGLWATRATGALGAAGGIVHGFTQGRRAGHAMLAREIAVRGGSTGMPPENWFSRERHWDWFGARPGYRWPAVQGLGWTSSRIRAEHVLDVWLAKTGLAVERYWMDRGALPETLGELTPAYLEAIPPDVHGNGQPLRYLTSGQGYRVYSVGYDQADNQGRIRQAGESMEATDIVWRVARGG